MAASSRCIGKKSSRRKSCVCTDQRWNQLFKFILFHFMSENFILLFEFQMDMQK